MENSYRLFECKRCGKKRKITKRKYTVKCVLCGEITKVPAMYEGLETIKYTVGVFGGKKY